jgi:hypothetical protein
LWRFLLFLEPADADETANNTLKAIIKIIMRFFFIFIPPFILNNTSLSIIAALFLKTSRVAKKSTKDPDFI